MKLPSLSRNCRLLLLDLPKDAILDGEIVAWSTSGAGTSPTFQRAPATSRPEESQRQADAGSPRRLSRVRRSLRRRRTPARPPACERARVLDELMTSAPTTTHVGTDAFLRLRSGPVPGERSSAALVRPQQGLFAFAARELPVATVLRAPVAIANSEQDLETLFTAARDRGNEGLMIKDLDSLYTPGRRGKSWLKMKRELATLDVVVTAVEYGHGKRIGVLSDYTFAVWDGERLVNIGKAYSGLTDAEIAEMTQWFLAHKVSEQGLRLEVEPKIVLEVAFNNMMRSTRHESGYALRFPRIVRLRPDKRPEDADTIETVKEIYGRQIGSRWSIVVRRCERFARRLTTIDQRLFSDRGDRGQSAHARRVLPPAPRSRSYAPSRRPRVPTGSSYGGCQTPARVSR